MRVRDRKSGARGPFARSMWNQKRDDGKLCVGGGRLQTGPIRSHANVQVCKLLEHIAVFTTHALREGGIIQFGLAVGLAQIAQGVQALQDRLTARLRQLLPVREHRLAHIGPLLGRHLLPDALAIAQILLLDGRQTIPRLEVLMNLGLLLRRKALESLIVLQEFFLLVGRKFLQTLHGLGGQIPRVCRGALRCGTFLGRIRTRRFFRKFFFAPLLLGGVALLRRPLRIRRTAK